MGHGWDDEIRAARLGVDDERAVALSIVRECLRERLPVAAARPLDELAELVVAALVERGLICGS